MEIRAQLRFLRQSPTKVRLVANVISGLAVRDAIAQLQYITKRSSGPLLKLVKSAVANAKHNHTISDEKLFIKKITVDQGPMLKRFKARAHGRAAPIRKRTSHITVILGEKNSKPETLNSKQIQSTKSE